MKQTAVEWLLEQLKINNYIQLSDNAHWVIDEAKEMEKEHIINAFEIGYENGAGVNEGEGIHYGSNYYNEKFKK
jgi:hypothetical protein